MSILDQFLNTLKDRGGNARKIFVNKKTIPIVNAKNPVQWSALAKAIAGGIIGAVAYGYQTFVDATTTAIVSLITGAREFLIDPREVFRFRGGYLTLEPRTGLIPQITDGVLGIVDAVWAPFTGFGWFAFPVAVAALLASLYPVMWAVSYVEEEVI